MAMIPMGQFAQARVIPQADSGRVNTGATERAGAGAAALGDALSGVANMGFDMAAQERNRERQESDALARAKASNAAAAYQLQVQSAVDDVADQLKRGGDYTKAGELFDHAMGKVEAPVIDGLDPAGSEHYSGAIIGSRDAGRRRIDGLVVASRRDEGQRQFATAIDLAGKMAGRDGADVGAINDAIRKSEEFYIANFGLDKSATSKAIQDRIDANWTNQAAQRFNAGNDDLEALQKLQHDVTAEDGMYADKLDSDKRNAIALKIGNRIDLLQRRSESMADRVDAGAEKALAAIDEQVSSGVPATVEQWAAWADVFKVSSPERQAEFRARIENEREVQEFLRRPIDQQLTEVQRRQADLYSAGGDKAARSNFSRLKSAVDANVKLLQENPLQFAQAREGLEVPPLDLTALADPARGGEIGAQLQQRAVAVQALRKRYGYKVANRVLLPQEAEMVSAALQKMPAAQKVSLFGSLSRGAGSVDNYRAIMQQIQPDAPVLAMAGLLHLKNQKAAKLVVEGEALINRSKLDGESDGKFRAVKLPPQTELDATVSDLVGAAFRGRPEAYSIAMQAVRAGYAGASATDGDVSGEVDNKRLRNIIKAVLGETEDFNGRGEVFIPYGMEPDDFDDKIDAAWRSISKSLPKDAPTNLGRYGLQQAGDGRYYVTAGRTFLQDASGKTVVIDLNKPASEVDIKRESPQLSTGAFGAF